jgi:transposase-like protein
MPEKRSRIFSRAFKLAAVRRMMAGENVTALSRELSVAFQVVRFW